MPYATVRRKGKLVNINKATGEVHGSFPDTAAGHARAAGQIAIMERAEGIGSAKSKKARTKRRKIWVPPTGGR